MWRYVVGGAAIVMLIGTGYFLSRQMANSQVIVPPPPAAVADGGVALAQAPKADDRSREARRFDRYDSDQNGRIGVAEFLASRRKAFARIDRNGDGQVSFDEYAAKAAERFSKADKDRSGSLDRPEFAATKPARKSRPKPNCAPAPQPETTAETGAEA